MPCQGTHQFLDGLALIFAFSSSETGRDRCLAIAAATISSWSSGGGTRSQALWLHTSWSFVRNLFLKEKHKDQLNNVCGARASFTYLDPNGALGFCSSSVSSRVKADVVAARSSSSMSGVVVDSVIAEGSGDRKMIGAPPTLPPRCQRTTKTAKGFPR